MIYDTCYCFLFLKFIAGVYESIMFVYKTKRVKAIAVLRKSR